VTSTDLRALADALFRDEVARATAMEPGEKLLAGPRLFDRACRLMADGIRHRRPDLDEEGVKVELGRQLTRLRALEVP
jgi:hypothetical protein